LQDIKHAMDQEFSPHWHAIVGTDFGLPWRLAFFTPLLSLGSLVTHEKKSFCFFKLRHVTFLVFKIG
jgi:hypothetical protein